MYHSFKWGKVKTPPLKLTSITFLKSFLQYQQRNELRNLSILISVRSQVGCDISKDQYYLCLGVGVGVCMFCARSGLCHRYWKKIPELLYSPMYWRHQPWSSNWGYSGFYRPPHWRGGSKQNVSTKSIFMLRPQCICTWRITVILFAGKTRIPQWSPTPR